MATLQEIAMVLGLRAVLKPSSSLFSPIVSPWEALTEAVALPPGVLRSGKRWLCRVWCGLWCVGEKGTLLLLGRPFL
jgi:hypothetical protein